MPLSQQSALLSVQYFSQSFLHLLGSPENMLIGSSWALYLFGQVPGPRWAVGHVVHFRASHLKYSNNLCYRTRYNKSKYYITVYALPYCFDANSNRKLNTVECIYVGVYYCIRIVCGIRLYGMIYS